ARSARRAENDFVGMPCGLLDQSAVLLSTEGRALFLDVRSLETEQVPFDPRADGLTVLTVDTRAPHRLVGGMYAERRRACEHAARVLGVPFLRDVPADGLAGALAALDDPVVRGAVWPPQPGRRTGRSAGCPRSGAAPASTPPGCWASRSCATSPPTGWPVRWRHWTTRWCAAGSGTWSPRTRACWRPSPCSAPAGSGRSARCSPPRTPRSGTTTR